MKTTTKRCGVLAIVLVLGAAYFSAGCGGGGGPASGGSDGSGSGDGGGDDGGTTPTLTFSALEMKGLSPTGKFDAAVAVANDGNLAVGISEDANSVINAVLWNPDSGPNAVSLGGLAAGVFNAAYAISPDGLVVGESGTGATNGFQAVVWRVEPKTGAVLSGPAGLQGLDGTGSCAAYGINVMGQIIGYCEQGVNKTEIAVLWQTTQSKPTSLSLPEAAAGSVAYSINDVGDVAGETLGAGGLSNAAMWVVDVDGAEVTRLDLETPAGHVSSAAFGVNDYWQVVGEAMRDTGETHAMMWTISNNSSATFVQHGDDTVDDNSYYATDSDGMLAVGWNVDPNKQHQQATYWELRSDVAPQPLAVPELTTGASMFFGINNRMMTVGVFTTADGSAQHAFVARPK